MRILHTSDWHLGQTFHGYDRTYEHQCFLDWLLERLESEQADVLLIAGDVFDNANPASASQKQLYRFLQSARLRVPHLRVVIIAGNHDSPARLEAPSPLLEHFDIKVVGQVTRDACGDIDLESLVIPLRDRSGRIGAWCLAVPFLRPGDVPRVETDGDPYLEGVAELYCRALESALARREADQAIVALGHCHMAGGAVSEESERRIVIGGAEMLPAGIFDSRIAYAALGHLHRAQAVGGSEWIRYCGSPLPLSFAETDYRHQIVRIDLQEARAVAIEPIRVPRFVDLLRIPAKPAPLTEVLEKLAALEAPDCPEDSQPYLEVRVRLEGPEPGLRAAIDEAIEYKGVRLARIEPTYGRANAAMEGDEAVSLEDLSRLQPDEIFRRAYRKTYGDEVPDELLAAFLELLVEPAETVDP